MGCSSSTEARGGAVSSSSAPAESRQGLRSLSTRAASVLTSLGLCRAGHDAAVHAYSPLPCEEAPPAGKGSAGDPCAADEALRGEGAAAAEQPPALDFDPATFPAMGVVPSPSHPALLYPEQENPPLPGTKPALRDIPEVTGLVRARVNEFHLKMLKNKKKKAAAAAAAAAAEKEAPCFFFGAGAGDDMTMPPKLRRPPGSGKKPAAVVLYFTSLHGVRRTFDDCRAVRAILRCYRVRLDERDVSMHAAFKSELRDLLLAAGVHGGGPALPRVFVVGGGRGFHDIGGAEELRELHEAGELGRALAGGCDDAPAAAGYVVGACAACGEARFVPCGTCHGSCKVFVDGEGCGRFAGFFRQCLDCNENGLIRCPVCCY